MISSICRSLLPCASNLIISRSLSVTTTCNSLEKSINYKSRTGRTPAEGTEGEMFYNISSDRAKKHIDNWIPTIETLDEYFNGVKYSDIPVCHIFCTKNNTKVTVTEVGTNETLLYTSASKEGFKNAKKKTEVAGQATGIAVGLKCLRRDITQYCKGTQLRGPRASNTCFSKEGMASAGLTVVSITDYTPLPEMGPRPKKVRRI